MTYIHFIVNPISGKGHHVITENIIREVLPEDGFRIKIHYTKFKGHATDLTKVAIALNADIVVACGGDGTINEVASVLVGTGKKLGIIPLGSGNGLSSNLNIPKDIAKALGVIYCGHCTTIDVGSVNDQYFFSNMGTGIDAMIIKEYEMSGKRTLRSYIVAALHANRKYKARINVIDIYDQIIEVLPLLMFISNSNEMGYGMALTPKASLQDGMLDLVIIKKLTLWHKLRLGYYVLRNQIEKFRQAQHILVKDLYIEIPDNIFTDVQIDGEYHNLKTNMLTISVIQNALNVIVPIE